MARFFLIRHGDKQHDDRMVGREPGIHLKRSGQAQARRLARHLRNLRVDQIYCSPLERARETVGPLAKGKGLPVEPSAAFDEIDMGEWTGRSKAAVTRTPEWKRFMRCSVGTSIPGGETLAEAQARFVSGLIRLAERARAANIVVGTHEDPIRLAVCYFIGAPIGAYEHITIRSGSLTQLTLDQRGAVLELLDVLPAGDPRLVLH